MKLTSKFLIVDGVRFSVRVYAGPWVPGVPAELIKLHPKNGTFPPAVCAVLDVQNNSDSRTDYFEADCIRLMLGHPLYAAAAVVAAAERGEA